MEQRRVSLTTRGVIALVVIPFSALAGALLGAEELVLLSLALCTLLLCALVQSASRARQARRKWRVGIALPRSDIEVDRLVDLTVTVTNTGAATAAPVWLEDGPHCWAPASGVTSAPLGRLPLPNPALVLRVPPLETAGHATFSFPAPTGSRGVFTLRGLRLWSFDTFGLVAQLVATGPSATVSVHPAPVVIELAEELLRGEQGPEDEPLVVATARPRRDSLGDFSGLRPYIPGDRLRLLYWPALARNDELMVRDFEEPGRPRRVEVVADIRPRLGGPGRESVLATVAGVGLRVLAQNAIVELSTTAGERVAIGPGPHGPVLLLRAIAHIDTTTWTGPARRFRLRRGSPAAPPEDRFIGPAAATALVVTTRDGARDLPGALAFAHLVLAP
jgi:uncharacterized protein (DUF58 family)